MPGREPDGTLREALRNGVHLAALSALALAQPLFDILGRNPTFFAVRGSSSLEIVLFAVALTLVPPAALVLIELAAGAFNRALARTLHLLFVGGLVAVLALTVLTKTDALPGAAALAAAAVVGAAAALVYVQARAARSFLTVLAPVPLVFLALFLLESPVSKLVRVDAPEVRAATVQARTPVVLIVFDEFSTVSLMNRRQGIDAGRYPNFAALAGDSTWFRSAASVYSLSEVAVPSVLTGRLPSPGRIPVYADYPNSLFTLLGGSYRVRAIEALTSLCPPALCRAARTAQSEEAPQTQAVSGAVRSLASDVGIVYLHLLVPEPYASRVPPISDTWGDFGDAAGDSDEPVVRGESGEIQACGRNTCNFTKLISPDRKPTLYFLHSMLPHTPYVYLPSGQRYVVDARLLRGLDDGIWSDGWGALQSQQRYLLQLGYTDRALGLVLDRLRSAGVYDRALVIVTADHGVSFALGESRRRPAPGNLDDIAFVPLFVKLPDQKKGRIDDSNVSAIDIVPTIARVLRIPVPWRVDGRPLVGRRLQAGGTVTMLRGDGSRVGTRLSALRAQRSRRLARQVGAFGTGSFATLYRIGPHRELLGRNTTELSVRPSAAIGVEIDGRPLLDAVDPASVLLPSYLEGRLTGTIAGRMDLAVAINGRVAAVSRTFRQGGQTRFAAFVPENALRAGRNAVDVFAVRGKGRTIVLEQLRGSDLSLTLRERAGGAVIESTQGTSIRVRPGVLRGTVRVSARGAAFAFSGFATHLPTSRPATSLIVFTDDRAVYVARTANIKPHPILGQPALGKSGFDFELPRALLPAGGSDHRVRVFAVRRGFASELRYVGAYPWARG
ncbi:MAG: sulfatase-like hydrolase/transferase [Gaiellaceae bacterium]